MTADQGCSQARNDGSEAETVEQDDEIVDPDASPVAEGLAGPATCCPSTSPQQHQTAVNGEAESAEGIEDPDAAMGDGGPTGR